MRLIRWGFNIYPSSPYKNGSDTVGYVNSLSQPYKNDGQYGWILIFNLQVRTKVPLVRLDFKMQLSGPYKILNSTVIY